MHNSFASIFGMYPFWWALTILILLGLIFYILDIQKRKTEREDTLEDLKKRFTKGKISKEEYKEARKYLKEFN